jgi:hypothetical protein
LGSLKSNFLYALMGKSNLMFYPYITLFLFDTLTLFPSFYSHSMALVLANVLTPTIQGTKSLMLSRNS